MGEAKPNPLTKASPESVDLDVLLEDGSLYGMGDLKALMFAIIEDIATSGSPREKMDLVQRLAPYTMKAAAEDEGDNSTEQNLRRIADIMASLWPGRCSNCGHLMSPHAAVDELDDDEDDEEDFGGSHS